MKRILLSAVPAAMLALFASPALATATMTAGADGGFAVGRAASWNSWTFGVTVRAGYEFDLGKMFFVGPEAGAGYMVVDDTDGIADGASVLPSEPEIIRVFGGLRAGFRGGDDDRVIPSLFVRGGPAWVRGGGFGRLIHTEARWLDVGFAIEYAMPPAIRFGGHAGFEALWARNFESGPFTGIHAGVAFSSTFGGHRRTVADKASR